MCTGHTKPWSSHLCWQKNANNAICHSQKIILNVTWMTNFRCLLRERCWVWPNQTHRAYSTLIGASIFRLHHNSTSQFSSNQDDLEEGFPMPSRKITLVISPCGFTWKSRISLTFGMTLVTVYHIDLDSNKVKVWGSHHVCGCPQVTLGATSLYR